MAVKRLSGWLQGWWTRRARRRVHYLAWRRLCRQRWESLPASVRTLQQVAGVGGVACGATHSIMEKCNFACTSCYLSEVANHTEKLPFEKVRQQLDELRRHLGPGGKVQITSGEVTLLEPDELGRIVAYARGIGLDPMVMTNGQRLLQKPDYLATLVGHYGLGKISFHIDTTQKGRPGMLLGLAEYQIDPIRDQFAALVKAVRRQTGQSLHAAHTVTVTRDNLGDIPGIVRWMLGNLDSFRILSLLPVAEVGRTQDRRLDGLGLEGVWEAVCQGIGRPLNRDAMHYGHVQCNITVPLLVVAASGRHHIIELVRAGRAWDQRLFSRGLRHLAGQLDFDDGLGRNALRAGRLLLGRPGFLLEGMLYGLYRLGGLAGVGLRCLGQVLRGRSVRLRPLLLVVHKFMSPDELDTPLGRERLEACVFKLPVEGRMVSMCQMNGTDMRRRLNVELLRRDRRDRAEEVV
ncbi:MAG: hypothetical protein GKR89_22835 [Candidatus Latescibacteria bacterium]|nr:hypothetical protein [Candidatus Latescibacterota bacterium]